MKHKYMYHNFFHPFSDILFFIYTLILRVANGVLFIITCFVLFFVVVGSSLLID